ncbi:MAG: amidase [Thermoanaerobaculia bacterium]
MNRDSAVGGNISRRDFIRASAVGGAVVAAGPVACGREEAPSAEPTPPTPPPTPFELAELTLAELGEGMDSGRFTARSITEMYLVRIEQLDRRGPTLRAIIETNPDALSIAEQLDEERRATGPRGPLHGIPVLRKDNIDTADRMTTTAGSYALEGSIPPRDSFVAEKLRAAGAILLAKANLSEWANIRSMFSSSGWSARGGLCRNPYALNRNPCGSSSGSAVGVSANLGAVAIGTETDGSVVCPANANGIVGIKPTVGLVSRSGIIPISHSQDTAGPMARTVTDAAILLGALTGIDPRDEATAASDGQADVDYTRFLDADGLRGARIGVARQYFGFHPEVDKLMEAALEAMKGLGAVLVDPADIPTRGKFDDAEFEVLLYEFKADLNSYLAGLGESAPVRTLAEIIDFNEQNADRQMPYFGQDLFYQAEEKGLLTSPDYLRALKKSRRLSREEGIDAVMDTNRLDAVIAPTGGPAWTTDLVNGDHFLGGSSSAAAVAGYPNLTVPAGFVRGLPVGISFFGRAWSEPTLIKLAYAFEQTTQSRQPPEFKPTADL